MASVGAVVSGGGWRVMVMDFGAAFPALSVARAVMVLLPTASATPASVQVPVAALSVAAVPLTVACATPEAYWPGSLLVPLTVIVSAVVVELFAGAEIVSVGAVVSGGDWRVTVTERVVAFPALSNARAVM